MKLSNITKRKNKNKFKSPTKDLIIEWALNTYKTNSIKDGNIFSFFILFFVSIQIYRDYK